MNNSIVAGWTDTAEGNAALDWAVHQGLLTGRSVVAVHEVGGDPPDGNGHSRSDAERAMARIRRSYQDEFPDLAFQTVVEGDTPAAGLSRWSRSADILAVGSPPDRHHRMLGALTDHLAAAADAPVALVPREWRRTATSDRCVVVGAATTVTGKAATSFAAAEAVRMAAKLVVVIGGHPGSSSGRATWAQVDAVAIANPGLTVEILWEHDDVARALIGFSTRAQLIVLGTHHSTDRWSIRLGPITETVLGKTACPVITVGRLHTPVSLRRDAAPTANHRPAVAQHAG